MSLLQFEHIYKSFSGVEVLHDIHFSIEKGNVVALLGENGAGKSTLMKILCGILPDYRGTLYLNEQPVHFNKPGEAESAGISIIHQELNLVPDLNVAENIFLGNEPLQQMDLIDYKAMTQQSEQALSEFDFPYSTNIKIRNLPIGWQQMVEIAKALLIKAEIIVMDEPTSALSNSEIAFLFDKIKRLKQQGKTIIYISHRMKEIFEIADKVAILRDGYFMGQYDIQEVDNQFLISRMIGKKVSDMSELLAPPEDKPLLKLENVHVNRKGCTALQEVDFSLKHGEVLGIAGLLGSGRTELLKFIYGDYRARFKGAITYNDKPYMPQSPSRAIAQRIVYLSEDRKREGIFSGMSNLKNSSMSILPALSRFGFIKQREEKRVVKAKTTELNVRMTSLQQHINYLSGGNQQKVLLARVLLIQPKLLLLDEPTRGIDVGAKQEIYNLIRKLQSSGVSIILTSSEIPELLWITNRILVLSGGRQTALLNTTETNSKEILSYAFKQV